MTSITLDSAAARKLAAVSGVVEVRDETGRVLGRFVPAEERKQAYRGVDPPPVPEAELDRRFREDARFTTEEVLEHLSRRSDP